MKMGIMFWKYIFCDIVITRLAIFDRFMNEVYKGLLNYHVSCQLNHHIYHPYQQLLVFLLFALHHQHLSLFLNNPLLI